MKLVVIEEVVDLVRQIHLEVDSDYVQKLQHSHKQKLTIDELLEMHEQEQDSEEFESLDKVQSEVRMTIGGYGHDLVEDMPRVRVLDPLKTHRIVGVDTRKICRGQSPLVGLMQPETTFGALESSSSVPGKGIRVVRQYPANLQEILKFDFRFLFTILKYTRNAIFCSKTFRVDRGELFLGGSFCSSKPLSGELGSTGHSANSHRVTLQCDVDTALSFAKLMTN
ncbi:hypothetical protein TNCV_2245201 [Trichonephila clavipes]|nr:hypothetical protein TNCV_2245201 [Trichonephila clavipes]